jgi:hypothetical protein
MYIPDKVTSKFHEQVETRHNHVVCGEGMLLQFQHEKLLCVSCGNRGHVEACCTPLMKEMTKIHGVGLHNKCTRIIKGNKIYQSPTKDSQPVISVKNKEGEISHHFSQLEKPHTVEKVERADNSQQKQTEMFLEKVVQSIQPNSNSTESIKAFKKEFEENKMDQLNPSQLKHAKKTAKEQFYKIKNEQQYIAEKEFEKKKEEWKSKKSEKSEKKNSSKKEKENKKIFEKNIKFNQLKIFENFKSEENTKEGNKKTFYITSVFIYVYCQALLLHNIIKNEENKQNQNKHFQRLHEKDSVSLSDIKNSLTSTKKEKIFLRLGTKPPDKLINERKK